MITEKRSGFKSSSLICMEPAKSIKLSIDPMSNREKSRSCIIDVIEVLTDSLSPRTYWVKLKSREFQIPPFWEQLKMTAKDGKSRFTYCANTEGIVRVLMSVPSPKVEQVMRWLMELGKKSA